MIRPTIKMWRSRLSINTKPFFSWFKKKLFSTHAVDFFECFGIVAAAIAFLGGCIWLVFMSPYSNIQLDRPAPIGRIESSIKDSKCVRITLRERTSSGAVVVTNRMLNETREACKVTDDPTIERQQQLLNKDN